MSSTSHNGWWLLNSLRKWVKELNTFLALNTQEELSSTKEIFSSPKLKQVLTTRRENRLFRQHTRTWRNLQGLRWISWRTRHKIRPYTRMCSHTERRCWWRQPKSLSCRMNMLRKHSDIQRRINKVCSTRSTMQILRMWQGNRCFTMYCSLLLTLFTPTQIQSKIKRYPKDREEFMSLKQGHVSSSIKAQESQRN